MRVIRTKKKKLTTRVILLMGITSFGLVIGGAIVGNPILIGAGFAGGILMCGMLLQQGSTRATSFA